MISSLRYARSRLHKTSRHFVALICRPRINLVLKITLVFIVFCLIALIRLDPDFGWHLQAGNYIRGHGIPSHDIFTYTARTFRWIDHEWGNDVIVSLLYGLGGYGLLAVVFGGVWTLALFMAGSRSRLLVLLLAVAAMTPYAGIRPIAWTVLFLALLLKVLPGSHRRLIWFLPILFVLWANLHAGFIVGLALIAYFAIRKRQKALVAILALSCLATFINPYGPRLYVEVARTTFDGSLHFEISEWSVLYIPAASAALICLWGAGFWLLRRKRLANWLDVGPIMLAATLSATRNMPLFVIATVKDLDNFYDDIKNKIPKELDRPRKIVLGLFVAVTIGWLTYVLGSTFIPWPQRNASYPVQAVAYLRSNPCQGHIFNDYDYGGYLIWQLPSQPVYIDGRMPSWRNSSGQKYLTIYNQVISNKTIRQRQFAKYDIQCVLLSRSSLNNKLLASLQKSGWKTAVQANGSELLIKP